MELEQKVNECEANFDLIKKIRSTLPRASLPSAPPASTGVSPAVVPGDDSMIPGMIPGSGMSWWGSHGIVGGCSSAVGSAQGLAGC